METRTRDVLRKNAPWRHGIPWQVVAVEGAIILGVGLIMLISPDDARNIVRQLLAAILLIHSAIVLTTAFRTPVNDMQRYQLVRATIGVTVGAIVTLAPISDYLSASASRLILGAGLVAHAVVGFGSMIPRRAEGRRLLGEGVTVVLTAILAITLLANSGSDETRTAVFGGLVMINGVLLAVYAAWLRKSPSAPSAAPAAAVTA